MSPLRLHDGHNRAQKGASSNGNSPYHRMDRDCLRHQRRHDLRGPRADRVRFRNGRRSGSCVHLGGDPASLAGDVVCTRFDRNQFGSFAAVHARGVHQLEDVVGDFGFCAGGGVCADAVHAGNAELFGDQEQTRPGDEKFGEAARIDV
uniref:(northern house mosquito) hypothetical protein n=1 Tax=Culex pipiens TaxID=7175 RepID=A0A8D8HED0_CULPI